MPGPPARGIFSAKAGGVTLNVDRGVTFTGESRASPFCPVAKRRRYFAERAPGADLARARGTSAEFTTGTYCLVARIRGWRKQGRAAGNLCGVAPRVSCAGNLREHYANVAAPSARCINYAPDSARNVGEGQAAPALFFSAAAFSSLLAPTRPRFPFFELGFLQPPAAFSSLRAVSPFLSGPPPPQFSSFWSCNVGCGFLYCVCLSRGAAAV